MEAFVAASDLPKSPGHPFYVALSRLLAENTFGAFVERLCAPCYAETMGRPGVPPSGFFRMLFVGYSEGLKSLDRRVPRPLVHRPGAESLLRQ